MNEELKDAESINQEIEVGKNAFRQRRRELPLGEKMRIAFALAERDKTIRRAVLLPKIKRKDG